MAETRATVGAFPRQGRHDAPAGGPLPGNLYRLRIGDANLSQAELAKVAARMAQEEAVELAVAVQ